MIEEIINPKLNDRVALIDADFLLYYCTFPVDELGEDGNPIVDEETGKNRKRERTLEEACRSVDHTLVSILSEIGTYEYIGFIGYGLNFRYKVDPSYKSNRAGAVKPQLFQKVKSYLWDVWQFEKAVEYEADDFILSLSKIYKNGVIVSCDKDLLMLVGKHYNPQKKTWVETNELEADKFFWRSMVVGDSADGIVGLPKKGEKYFEKMWGKYKMELTYTSPAFILELYVENLGTDEGIRKFFSNYDLLKLRDNLNVSIFTSQTYNGKLTFKSSSNTEVMNGATNNQSGISSTPNEYHDYSNLF